MLLGNLNVHESPLGALTLTYLCCRCLITEEKLVVENKGFDSYLADNCANIIFSTNWGDDDVILPIGVCCTWGAAIACFVIERWCANLKRKTIAGSSYTMYNRKTSIHLRRSSKWAYCVFMFNACTV